MVQPPITRLPKKKRSELLRNLNYLNTTEIKSFCKQHSIPFRIAIGTKDGGRKITQDDDRKGVMLARVRRFLQTGVVPEETYFPSSVVCFDPLPRKLTPADRLFYGQYQKTNRALITVLRDLTGGRFINGAIARILAREFWSRGEAPTFNEFASAWLRASRGHTKPNPEWAFLSDRANKAAISDWKTSRTHTASKVMRILNRITSQ
ncbi:MAG TPA: hypothetical protein VEC08_05780 [Nitrososphaerales archaeon]|nr:hypothetical protein [Nitrososphaerales archaeon]